MKLTLPLIQKLFKMSNDKSKYDDESVKKNNQDTVNAEGKEATVDDQTEKEPDQKREASAENQQKERTETDQLKEDLSKEKDKYMRLFAEFENYKRRTSKERVEMFKTASQDVMLAMLPVLDDFERALKEIRKSADKELLEGIEIISDKLQKTLHQQGLEEMKVKSGDKFDADLHEAVSQIPAPKKKMKGKIIDIIEKGYTLGDKIIRHPKVVTGQ